MRSGPLVTAIKQQDEREVGRLIQNDLEKVVFPKHPQVEQLKQAFAQRDVLGTMMSGSGPTVFALCETKASAIAVEKEVREQINDPQLKFWITKFSTTGITIKP